MSRKFVELDIKKNREAQKHSACPSGLALVAPISRASVNASNISLTDISRSVHESAMREAINVARKNPRYPFGAVITKANTGQIVASGVNSAASNPTIHGEIACINNYVERHGNTGWSEMILYATGEPCAMCTGAMLWSGIGGVVYASSIATIGRAGMGQIAISTKDVIAASDFWQSALLGGGSLSALLRGTDSELAEHRLNLL